MNSWYEQVSATADVAGWVLAGWAAAALVGLVLVWPLCRAAARGDAHLAAVEAQRRAADETGAVRRDEELLQQLAEGVPVREIPGADEVAAVFGVWRDRCRDGTYRPDRGAIGAIADAWGAGS